MVREGEWNPNPLAHSDSAEWGEWPRFRAKTHRLRVCEEEVVLLLERGNQLEESVEGYVGEERNQWKAKPAGDRREGKGRIERNAGTATMGRWVGDELRYASGPLVRGRRLSNRAWLLHEPSGSQDPGIMTTKPTTDHTNKTRRKSLPFRLADSHLNQWREDARYAAMNGVQLCTTVCRYSLTAMQ